MGPLMENIHDFVVSELTRCGRPEWDAVAEATHVPVHTIIKIARRITKSPRYSTLLPLAAHFSKTREAA